MKVKWEVKIKERGKRKGGEGRWTREERENDEEAVEKKQKESKGDGGLTGRRTFSTTVCWSNKCQTASRDMTPW